MQRKIAEKCLLLGLSIFVIIANMGCSGCNEKANFKICTIPSEERDIVFIIDQSGTMYRNDRSAQRWEAMIQLASQILLDETSFSPTINLNRFAFIPFGKDVETIQYNKELKWYDRSNFSELTQFLKYWHHRSQADTATYSDFNTPFKLLSERLEWRENAKRYIFFISDGKFNVLPDIYKKEEEQRFGSLLTFLQQKRSEWPVFFIGVGKHGYDTRNEPYVDKDRLIKMAQSMPLPHNLLIDKLPTTFFEPTRLASNALIIQSTDSSITLKSLRQELEHVLRGTRYANSEIIEKMNYFFPIIHPEFVEVELNAKEEIAIDQLAEKINFFVETKSMKHPLEALKLVFPGNGLPPSRFHRFKVDTTTLSNKIPDVKAIKSWGLKTADDSDIALTEVNLIIKDNWSILVDSCSIIRVPKSRTWWERFRHKPTQPTFQLSLAVTAVHPCAGILPCKLMNVSIENDKIIKKKKAMNSNDVVRNPLQDDITSIYSWQASISDCERLEQNIGSIVRVGIEIEDLYACNLQIPTEVPLNARILDMK